MTDEPSRGSAADPNAERQYHLEVTAEDVAETVLLPGNPERVDPIVEQWADAEVVAEHREYRTATGRYAGRSASAADTAGDPAGDAAGDPAGDAADATPISVTSTGIGSPSAAIAVEELARVGADTLLRVGSCGAIQPEIDVGDLVITTGGVRQEGTSDEYVREDYPAVADRQVVGALVAAAERLGYTYHTGPTASTDSFYAGQARSGFEGYRAPDSEDLLDELAAAGVANVEMETSAILTLAGIYDLRAGAVCAVYADRTSDEFAVEGEQRAIEVACEAAAILEAMDERAADAGAEAWYPGLGLEE